MLAGAHPTFRDAKKRSNDPMSHPAREERAAKRARNRANQGEVEDAASILIDLRFRCEQTDPPAQSELWTKPPRRHAGHSLEDVLVYHWIMSDTVVALVLYINKFTE